MISCLIIWIYILMTAYAAGSLIVLSAHKAIGYKPKDLLSIILAGLVCVTVYAQFASLFGGVGLAANLIMCIILILGCLIFRKRLAAGTVLITGADRRGLLCLAVLLAVMAYGTSHGIMHYDTGLYHAQAIRWIENYGVVPGLANLHTRLGYNSSAFVLNALYSFGFTGRSYHVTTGFCAFLLAWECIVTPVENHRSVMSVAGMARIMGIYYLLMIYDEMVSPASDYYMVTLAFIMVIRWAEYSVSQSLRDDTDPDNDDNTACFSMLTFLACFIITVKLSGAVFVLLAILPAYRYLHCKDVKRLLVCFLTGFVIIIPYLIRNVILSGRLLYPSTALDLFNVSWKVPYDIASYDFKEIQVYGRGFTDVSAYNMPITGWFPDWFAMQSLTDRILIASAIVGVLCFVIKCLLKAKTGRETAFVTGVVCIGFIFWLFTSPLMRYGCLYVYLCDALIWGSVIAASAENRIVIRRMAYAGMTALLAYKAIMFVTENVQSYRSDTWIMQQDYDSFETEDYEIEYLSGKGSETFYAPVSGDRTGYDPFPSSPWKMNQSVVLRGDNIRDGFEGGHDD